MSAPKKSTRREYSSHPIWLFLHNIRSTHNVGAIFRTADAAGVNRIILSGYTPRPIDRFGRPVPELAKTALGAEKTLEWTYIRQLGPTLARLKRQNALIIGLEQDAKAVDYKKVNLAKLNKSAQSSATPIIFLVGNEVRGLSPAVRRACDILAEIPMRGAKESLNVSVALGIALFRILNI
jgi:tRNA G18 (ribose-2'-O)-methylase SpoU